MFRILRWGAAAALATAVLVAVLVLLPFQEWLPGGTVADVPVAQVVNGSAFNRLFPEAPADGDLVFRQEKRGFAQARLRQGSEVRALLSISDVITAPEATEKFRDASATLEGWPLVEQGRAASALLVADRFQVKVIDQGEGLDAAQRHELLARFDLAGLSRLKPALPGMVVPMLAPLQGMRP
jgi:hypothetical protein